MLDAYRYLLFIIFPFVLDTFYYRFLGTSYTQQHLEPIYVPSDGRVDNYYIRIFAVVSIYVIYGLAFGYLTSDLQDKVCPTIFIFLFTLFS